MEDCKKHLHIIALAPAGIVFGGRESEVNQGRSCKGGHRVGGSRGRSAPDEKFNEKFTIFKKFSRKFRDFFRNFREFLAKIWTKS